MRRHAPRVRGDRRRSAPREGGLQPRHRRLERIEDPLHFPRLAHGFGAGCIVVAFVGRSADDSSSIAGRQAPEIITVVNTSPTFGA